MDRAKGHLQVQKVPRWRLTIKNLQEDVEVARRRESLGSSRPDESEREPKTSLVLPVEGAHPGRWNLDPRPLLAYLHAPGGSGVGEQFRVG